VTTQTGKTQPGCDDPTRQTALRPRNAIVTMAPKCTRVNLKCEACASIEEIFKTFSQVELNNFREPRSRPLRFTTTRSMVKLRLHRSGGSRALLVASQGKRPKGFRPMKALSDWLVGAGSVFKNSVRETLTLGVAIRPRSAGSKPTARKTTRPAFLGVKSSAQRAHNMTVLRDVFVGITSFLPLTHLYGSTRQSQPFDNGSSFY